MKVYVKGGNLTPRHPKTTQPIVTKICIVTTWVISTTTQNFIQIDLGVSVLRMRDFAPSVQSDSAIFFGGGGFLRKATAETRAPILTQNTSNDAVPHKEVPFGGRETSI